MICCLLMGWSGCGLLKQTVKTVDATRQDSTLKTEVNLKDERELVKKSLSLTTKRDAAGATYQLLLWPKGKFTFSAEKGFEGEADSIRLNGEDWAFENHSEILSTDDQQKAQLAVEGKQELKTKSVQEKTSIKSYADYKLIIGLTVMLFVLLFWFLKK